jgi:hypothetical protein
MDKAGGNKGIRQPVQLEVADPIGIEFVCFVGLLPKAPILSESIQALHVRAIESIP